MPKGGVYLAQNHPFTAVAYLSVELHAWLRGPCLDTVKFLRPYFTLMGCFFKNARTFLTIAQSHW